MTVAPAISHRGYLACLEAKACRSAMNEGKFRIGSGSRSGRTAAYTRYRLSGAAKMIAKSLRPYQIERNTCPTCPLEIALQVARIFIPQWATPA